MGLFENMRIQEYKKAFIGKIPASDYILQVQLQHLSGKV
jgi:hypothetical protein